MAKTIKTLLAHFVIDFVAAILLLVCLVFVICFGVELFNHLIAKKPDLMIDLPGLIESAKEEPFGAEGLWITLMLFSTLAPTFAHFVIAFIGIYTFSLTPKKVRENIADALRDNPSRRSLTMPAMYFTFRNVLVIAATGGFWCLAGYLINANLIHFADILSRVAYYGIELANSLLS